jgi:hypothetical protein
MDIRRDIVFTFSTEDGCEKMTLAEYEKKPKLQTLFGRQSTPPIGRQTLFLGKDIFSFRDDWLKQNVKKAKAFEAARAVYLENPLKYFLPQTNTAIDFLNWPDNPQHSLKVLHSGVGSGKTVLGCVDWLLSTIPTEADWPIFKFGVKQREYGGPLREGGVAVMSYQMTNHQNTIWPQVIRRWCPRKYIEEYITGRKSISWRGNPQISVCETPVYFMVYGQKETAFTSQALDIIHWDEQTKESIFNNANDRVQRRGGRHIMTMTPQDKTACLEEYIHAPTREGNKKKLAEGRSKVYGDFHESSGLVLDDWDRSVHMIEPFEVPEWWTFMRYHDHGRKEPNAAILVAINENEDYFIVNEWYGRDKEISENAVGIIREMTGNDITEDSFGKQEVMSRLDIVRTISDPRSLSKALDNSQRTIQEEYAAAGLDLSHGSGQPPEKLVGLVGELLRLDPNRNHYASRQPGAPKVYVFDTCREFIKEVEGWRMRKVRVGGASGIGVREKPEPKNDHLMTCFMLLAEDRPMYLPKKMVDKGIWIVDNEQKEEAKCPLSGY